MRAIVFLLSILFLGLPAPVAAESFGMPVSPINRSSPGDTYHSFLAITKQIEEHYAEYVAGKTQAKLYLLRGDLERARRLMDLSALPASTRVKVGNAAIGYLNDILARVPPLDAADSSGGNNIRPFGPAQAHSPAENAQSSTWTIPGTDIQIAYIENGLHSGNYMFTAESIASLPAYYREISGNAPLNPSLNPNFHIEQMNATGLLISEDFMASLPEALTATYFDTPLWKIIATIAVMIAFMVTSLLWLWFAHHRTANLTPLRRIWWRLTIPLVVLVLLWTSERFVATQINPIGAFAVQALMLVTLIRYVAAALMAWLLIQFAVEAMIEPRRNTADREYDANLLLIGARIIGFISVGVILGIGADRLGIPALGLVAGLGVGGVAVAFAAQSTLENLFGGLALFADRPFHLGDNILIGSQSASVERIGARSSRLRARDGTLFTVPNADLAKMQIVNLTLRDSCFLDQSIVVKEDSSPELIQALLDKVRELFDASDLIEKKGGWPRVYIVGVSPGQIRLQFQARVQTTDYNIFLAEQERILLLVLGMKRDLGLELSQHIPVTLGHRHHA